MTLIDIVDELVTQYIAVHGQHNWGEEVDLPEKLVEAVFQRLLIENIITENQFRNPNRFMQMTDHRRQVEQYINEDAARRNLLFTIEMYKVGTLAAYSVRIHDLSLIQGLDELDVKILQA